MITENGSQEAPFALELGEVPDGAIVAATVTSHWPVVVVREDEKRPVVHRSDPRTPDGRTGEQHRNVWLTSAEAVVGVAETGRVRLDDGSDHSPQFAVILGEPDDAGRRLVVLDTDSASAEARLVQLVEGLPGGREWLATTMTVRTARGCHRYGTTSLELSNARPWGPGSDDPSTALDLKARGLVLLPGARHPSGARYRDVTGEDGTHRGLEPHDDPPSIYRTVEHEGDGLVVVWSLVRPLPAGLLEALGAVESRRPRVEVPLGNTIADGSAFDRVVAALQDRALLTGAVSSGSVLARCPAHDDREPSLSVTAADGRVLVNCFAGCAFDDVMRALGLEPRDAFDDAVPGERDPITYTATEGAEAVTERDDRDHNETNGADAAADAPMTEAEFWQARPVLAAVLRFARARRVGPWALLGAVLARAAASVSPSIVLPPTRASVASLNTYVALCGASGSGKSAAMDAAREFLNIRGGVEFLETAPGSGEGLLSAYGETEQRDGKPPEFVQRRMSMLLESDEAEGLGSLKARTNSTLAAFLKTAWVGRRLATQNAETRRVRNVPPHSYRLALVVGVQPAHAEVLLDDAAGGFPQRFLWLPLYDPGMLGRHERVDEPAPWEWCVPGSRPNVASDGSLVLPPTRTVMRLPDAAVEAILDAAEAANRPMHASASSGDLDGHALLSRAKVAALLALLDGRAVEVSADDWRLAGRVMAVSDATRAEVIAIRAAAAMAESDNRAARVGRSAAIAADTEAETKVQRAMPRLLSLLDDGQEHATGALRKRLTASLRDVMDDATDRLVETGQVGRSTRVNAKGVETEYLRKAGGAK